MAEETKTESASESKETKIEPTSIPNAASTLYTVVKDIFKDEDATVDTWKGEDHIVKDNFSNLDKSTNYDGVNVENDSGASNFVFELPNWGIEDYIGDRNKWVKGIRGIGDEPGWFYFKVFFKFNTQYGLFGGLMNGTEIGALTSAWHYLNTISTLYKAEQIPSRLLALRRFTYMLSKINSEYPWIIKSINGIDKAMLPTLDKFSEEKSFELVFNVESTDMKIINMLNLYKYTCYDDINCKEIIPENLRKFDVMVVFYHVPIKYFQTAVMISPKRDITTGIMKPGTKLAKAEEIVNKTFNFLTTKSQVFNYKRLHPDNDNPTNMMSFTSFTFTGCEIDPESLGKYYEGSEIKNDEPFQFTETAIKINYDKVYSHTFNEWNQILYGTDGFYYDGNSEIINGSLNTSTNFFNDRMKAIKDARSSGSVTFFDKNATQYKAMIDYSESVITDGLMNMDMKNYYAFLKGNIYGDVSAGSDYFNAKMEVLKEGSVKGNIFGDVNGLQQLKHQALKEGTIQGNIFGTDKLLGSDESLLNKKIKALKKGTIRGNIYSGLERADGDGSEEYKYGDNAGASWVFDPIISEIAKDVSELESSMKPKNDELRTQIRQKIDTLQPTLEIDQAARQKKDIFNYLGSLAGNSKLTGQNKGLLSGVLGAANDVASFWKMSKNDWK